MVFANNLLSLNLPFDSWFLLLLSLSLIALIVLIWRTHIPARYQEKTSHATTFMERMLAARKRKKKKRRRTERERQWARKIKRKERTNK